VTTLAVLAGLAVQPGSVRLNVEPVSDSPPWYSDTAAEQLRQDQCLMSEVLRLGGPTMTAVTQDGLNQPADKLRVLANREYWEKTPLSGAYDSDRAAADKQLDDLAALERGWMKPVEGLTTPVGISDVEFHWPPGMANDGRQSFYEQTGLTAWVAGRFWKSEDDFYGDSTPEADTRTLKAGDDLGNPLYGKDPVWMTGAAQEEWERALDEHSAFQWMHGGPGTNAGADDARIFLSSGGFPRTAPQPGTPEYRIAVEDVKTRFASCAWRDPLDPDRVLDDVTAAAAGEWQQEISSQATQRNQILGRTRTPPTPSPRAQKLSPSCWDSPGSPTTSPTGRTTGRPEASATSVTLRWSSRCLALPASASTSRAAARPTAPRYRFIPATAALPRSGACTVCTTAATCCATVTRASAWMC
jgi:hypothetical protein